MSATTRTALAALIAVIFGLLILAATHQPTTEPPRSPSPIPTDYQLPTQ